MKILNKSRDYTCRGDRCLPLLGEQRVFLSRMEDIMKLLSSFIYADVPPFQKKNLG